MVNVLAKNILFFNVIGRARFNLSDMPLSLQKRQQSNQPQCNLFKAKRVKGWWPVYYCEKDGTETQSVRRLDNNSMQQLKK